MMSSSNLDRAFLSGVEAHIHWDCRACTEWKISLRERERERVYTYAESYLSDLNRCYELRTRGLSGKSVFSNPALGRLSRESILLIRNLTNACMMEYVAARSRYGGGHEGDSWRPGRTRHVAISRVAIV